MDKSYIDISNIDAHWKERLKGIFSSSRINFLFGAGVNGSAFKGLSSYKKTHEKIKCYYDSCESTINIEETIDKIDDETKKSEVIDTFINEFNEKYEAYLNEVKKCSNMKSVENLKEMLLKTQRIVNVRETRNDNLYRKVNIFTLNYDKILEYCLEKIGQHYIEVYPSNPKGIQNFDLINYNNDKRDFQTTVAIAKLHGTIVGDKLDKNNIIYPGNEKYNKLLHEGYFELLFKFKNELLKQNSVLIIVGYSGNDIHINQLINEGIDKGLSVIYFKYSNDDKDNKLISMNNNILVIGPIEENDSYQDTTKNFIHLIRELEIV